jgi:hypothetical protein
VTLALLRYLAADAIRAQRWTAPALLFLIAVVVLSAGPGPALPVYGVTSAALLPCALWLVVAVINGEDPVQAYITIVTAGSLLRVALARLAVALLACVPLALVGVGWPVLTGHHATWADVLAGSVAYLLAALAGVALGSVLSRPVLDRRAWAVLAGVLCCLGDILIPGAPPARQLVGAFLVSGRGWHDLAGPLGLAAGQTLLISAVLALAGYAVARRRI